MENARLLGELRQRTDEVAELNRGLEARVAEQVEELGRVSRLKRFLAPQLAELIVSRGDEKILESHRREIVVVFCDLRGYTAFTETAEPEEVLDFLREYHGALGPLVSQFEGTLDQFSGDGIMVFFNAILSRSPTRRSARSGWRWRCVRPPGRSSPTGAAAIASWDLARASPKATRRWARSALPSAPATPLSAPCATWPLGSAARNGAAITRALLFGGEADEFSLHRVDFREICRDVVIAAALAGQQMGAAACEGLCGTCAVEMNYRGQLLPPLPADRHGSLMPEDRRDVAVQEYRRKLGGAARHNPRIKRTRRATVLDDGMVENAIALRLSQGRVGHLVHAGAARRRLVDRVRIPGQMPSPIGIRDRIAGTLDLGQRGQQLR